MTTSENPYAGQGPVMLDIGGDIGALIVTAPAAMSGVEIEIRPRDGQPTGPSFHQAPHDHADHHAHDQPNDHAHDDDADGHSHDHEGPHLVHVAVVGRPSPAGVTYSAVFGDLGEGTYELSEKPFGEVRLTVDVTGGEIAQASWPS